MKKAIALVLALMLAVGCVTLLASCDKAPAPEETTVAADATDAETTAAAAEDTTAAEAVEDTTAAEAPVATEAATEAAVETTTAAETTAAAEEAPAVPTTKEEIVKVYNDAVNGAISAKAGYSKTRTTTVNSLEGGAIMKIKVAADAVKDFLGEGTKTYTNNKGKAEYMSKSNLSAGDVTSATCTEKDGKYTITMSLKDGSNAAGSSMSDNSALNRCGLYVGTSDKSAFDYKTTQNIYVALNGLDEASMEAGTGKTTGAKIVAVVDAATGHLESLNVDFNFSVVLNNVKYLIAKISEATGTATTSVKFSDFKY